MNDNDEFNAQLTRIADGLQRYSLMNHRPAIDEPANPFEEAVNNHAAVQELMAEVKSLLKPLETKEREMRDGIAASLVAHFGDELKEGVNTYVLSNSRKLKYKHGVTRSIDQPSVDLARAQYVENAEPTDPTFDELLRPKYELVKAKWNKLSAAAGLAFSRCLTSKTAAPTLEVD